MIQYQPQDDKSLIVTAINEIIVEFFDRNNENFLIVSNAIETFSRLFSSLGQFSKINIVNINSSRYFQSKIGLSTSSILLFDDFNSVNTFYDENICENIYTRTINFVIYCQHLTIDEIIGMKLAKIHNVYFLVRGKNHVDMLTPIWYSQYKCGGDIQLEYVNQFSRSSMKWKNPEILVKRHRNFHGCKLLFAVENHPPNVLVEEITNGKQLIDFKVVGGHAIDVINGLSKVLNYTVAYTLFLSETNKYHFGPALEVNLHIKVTGFSLRIPYYFSKEPYVFDEVSFLIPPSETYSNVEKLFLPFSIEVWIMVLIVFIIALLVIWLLNRTVSREIRNAIVGDNINTPTLNLLIAFNGGGMIVLPRNNLARFLLMLFILYSLVIRSLYQGELFKFLQSDNHKPEPKTIDELIEKDFTFYINQQFLESHKDMEFLKRFDTLKIKLLSYFTFYVFILFLLEQMFPLLAIIIH